MSIYSCLLNDRGVKGGDTPHGQKCMPNFCLPQDLTINSLPLIQSLTDNINRPARILYVTCIIYCILTNKSAKDNVIRKIIRRIENAFIALYLSNKVVWKWTRAVQRGVVQGSAVFYFIVIFLSLFLLEREGGSASEGRENPKQRGAPSDGAARDHWPAWKSRARCLIDGVPQAPGASLF